jgi:hypothetical protein
VLSLISAFTGLQSFHASISAGQSVNSSTNIVTVKSVVFRICAFIQAVLFAAATYGIHKKAPVTWKLGWVVFAVLFLNVLASALSSSLKLPPPDRWIASFAIVIGFGAVAAYWGFWWKRQKNYFESNETK